MDDLRTVLQHSWSKALLAASSVEEQAQALVGQLAAAPGADEAQKLLAEVKGKLEAHRRDLQSHVQHAVKSALDRIRLPSRAEVEALQARLAQLEARLASLKAGPGGRPSA